MVHIKDVIAVVSPGPDADAEKSKVNGYILNKLRRDVLFVPPSMPALDLLIRMQKTHIHMAIVIDEYGGTDGLVTMEDVIETLLGMEIMDELDKAEDMQALARRNWETRAKRLGLIEPAAETAEPTATPEQKPDGSAGARP